MVFWGCKQKKNCGFFCSFFLCSFGSKKQVLYTKPFFWQKDLNFEASGENAILGELTINWTFTFLHKSFGAQRIERVGVEKEEEEVGITKLCRKQVRNLFLAFKDKTRMLAKCLISCIALA